MKYVGMVFFVYCFSLCSNYDLYEDVHSLTVQAVVGVLCGMHDAAGYPFKLTPHYQAVIAAPQEGQSFHLLKNRLSIWVDRRHNDLFYQTNQICALWSVQNRMRLAVDQYCFSRRQRRIFWQGVYEEVEKFSKWDVQRYLNILRELGPQQHTTDEADLQMLPGR